MGLVTWLKEAVRETRGAFQWTERKEGTRCYGCNLHFQRAGRVAFPLKVYCGVEGRENDYRERWFCRECWLSLADEREQAEPMNQNRLGWDGYRVKLREWKRKLKWSKMKDFK